MMTYRKKTRIVRAADGTRLAWHTHGDGDLLSGRPTVLLTNGIGTTENFWKHLVAELSGDHRVVHWDYRGHGQSETSRGAGYSMRVLADDLARVTEAVLASGDGRPMHHVCFSMGVAVALELYRTRPELLPSMTLIAGSPDAPGSALFPFKVPAVSRSLRWALEKATPLVPCVVAPLARAVMRQPVVYDVARRLGALREGASREDVDQMLRGVCAMDALAYWRTLCGLAAAHASDVLPTVRGPVQIIAAGCDMFMPLRQMEQLREGLPAAEWLVFERAGHAILLEEGERVARAVRDFIARTEHARRGETGHMAWRSQRVDRPPSPAPGAAMAWH